MTATDRQPVIWFEVEDFLRYFDHFRNPTGMQRVAFEIFSEAEALYGRAGKVRFCRLSIYSRQFQVIGFSDVLAAYLHPPGANAPWKSIWEPAALLNNIVAVLPVFLRHPWFFLSLLKTAIGDMADRVFRQNDFGQHVRPGDIVVSLGAGWGLPGYLKNIAAAKHRYGIRFATMIYDLIPVENESLVEPHHTVQFREWLQEVLPVADVVLTISKHSRNTLIEWAAKNGQLLPSVQVMRLGTGLMERPAAGHQGAVRLPDRYVLFVSTIECRKNHQLLVRIWRRLLERHDAEAVPILVFAGQIGWKVDDLLADLDSSNYLGGKIVRLSGLSDAELRLVYRASLFTVFPSLSEGWGMPIAESLASGKFCVASDRTSIPEVAGGLIDYFDPSREDDVLAKIERVLFDPAYLAARTQRLRAEFRPPAWADCVHALVCNLDANAVVSEEPVTLSQAS